MMKYIFYVLVAIIIFGCQNVNKPIKPENLISKEEMVSILTDAYISNAARSFNYNLIKKIGIRLDSLLYEKYNIDSLQFAESNTFYSSDLKTYANIISKVEKRLLVLQNEKDSVYDVIKKEKGDTINFRNKGETKLLVDPVESKSN